MMTRITSSRHHSRKRSSNISGFWAAMICVGVLITSFLFFVVNASPGNTTSAGSGGGAFVPRFRLRGGRKSAQWVSPAAKPFNDRSAAANARNLIIVAGHSVIMAGNLEDAETDENVWYLLDYQIGKGLPQAIVSHIRAGIQEAANDPNALLIFSGGETRGQTGPVNEGISYYRVADALNLWTEGLDNAGGGASNVRARTTTEEFATDSFENLMFSVCRFREVTGTYPEKITVVSFTFKQRRFEEMHSKALLWPTGQFAYIGVDPPDSSGFDLREAQQGELKNAAQPFETDPYGCHTPVLQQKRKDRNPFARTPPYPLTCPDMSTLLQWCGPELIAQNDVPWR